jgi:hypothetical protein
MRPPKLCSELGSRRAKPATAESCSTGWISSHPTLLGILGSYVGPPITAQVGKRGNFKALAGWVSQIAVTVGDLVLTERARRHPRGKVQYIGVRQLLCTLRSAHEPRGRGDGLGLLEFESLKQVPPSLASTVRLRPPDGARHCPGLQSSSLEKVSTVGGEILGESPTARAHGQIQ